MKKIICILIVCSATILLGQEKKSCVKTKDSLTGQLVYKFPETFPAPTIGRENFGLYLMKEMKVEPNEYKDGIFDEKLTAVFIVTTEGGIIGERIITKSTSKRLETKFLKLIKKAHWKNGFCENEPVDSLVEFSVMIYTKQ